MPELQNDLYISLDLNYINKENFQAAYSHAQQITQLVIWFINYLKSLNQNYKKTSKINEQI